jgi:hypothetical protein
MASLDNIAVARFRGLDTMPHPPTGIFTFINREIYGEFNWCKGYTPKLDTKPPHARYFRRFVTKW